MDGQAKDANEDAAQVMRDVHRWLCGRARDEWAQGDGDAATRHEQMALGIRIVMDKLGVSR